MKTGAPLKTAATPKGILHLEFAYDKAQVNTIITAWSVDNKLAAAKTNTYWDFCFLFFYAFFLFFTCVKLSEKFSAAGWKNKAGLFFAKMAILAGMLDIGENIGMLQTLNGNGNTTSWQITTGCAATKWSLVILVILYILFAVIAKRGRA